MRHLLPIFVTTCTMALVTGPAAADALDGDWCNAVNGKLTIDGSVIITPKGNRVMGNYGRHRFTYTAPDTGWNPGKNIVIQQFSDTLMELTVEGQPAQQWKPCQVIS